MVGGEGGAKSLRQVQHMPSLEVALSIYCNLVGVCTQSAPTF
jgi:hypothetical protein